MSFGKWFCVFHLSRYKAVHAVCLLALSMLAGCVPDTDSDGSYRISRLFSLSSGQDDGYHTSNRAAKTDLLSFSAAPGEKGSLERRHEFSVETTAAKVMAALPSARIPKQQAEPVTTTISFPHLPEIPAEKALASFYDALRALDSGQRKRPVTILHLGDDHIAADRFTSDLRKRFQSRFGDAGRGFMAPGVFRADGVKIAKGGYWSVASSARDDPGAYGLAGVNVSADSRKSWLRLTATDGPFDFAEVTFLVSPQTGSAEISVDGAPKTVTTRSSVPSWKRIRLNRKGRELLVRPSGDGAITLLSWAIGNNRPGVRYVSLGLPGATALTTERWSEPLIAADIKAIEPDLIIVSYGTNEGFDDNLDVKDYAARVERMLKLLKREAPNVSLLVIGPPDAARMPQFAVASGVATDACRPLGKNERKLYRASIRARDPRLGRWHTPLRLDTVREALAYQAARIGAWYWDWSEIMGGSCGIHAWVHQTPQLAASDHVHLTAEGSRRSADALFLRLIYGYDRYSQLALKVAK